MAQSEITMKMSLITSGVKTALKGMQTSVANFSRAASEKLNALTKIVSGALVAAFVAAGKASMTYAQEMKNLSDFAGVGFKEFQKLAAGARTVGIGHEKLADIFKDVEEKMGELQARGQGGFADFFEEIAPLVGATKEEFIGLNGNEVLQKYVNYLEEANVSQAQMSFYLEAIGSDAKTLAPLYSNLGEKFRQAGDAAVAGGQVMSDATEKNLKKAQDKIDAFKVAAIIKVGELIGGANGNAALKQLGAEFMALMAKVGGWMANAFIGAVKTLVMGLTAAVTLAGEKLVQGFEFAVAKLTVLLAPVIESLAKVMGFDIKIDTSDARQKLEDLKNVISPTFAERFYEVGDALGDWTFNVDEQHGYWMKIAEEQGKIIASQQELDDFIKSMKGTTGELNELAEIKKKKAEAELNLLKEIHGTNYDLIKDLETEVDEYSKIISYVTEHKQSVEEARAIIEKQNGQLSDQQAIYDMLAAARAAGDDRAEAFLIIQIKLLEDAKKIMDETGQSYEQAYQYAYDKYVVDTDDYDLNGEVTKQEEKKGELFRKALEKAKKKKGFMEGEESILRRKLIPNYKEVQKANEKALRSLRSQKEVNEKINPKIVKNKSSETKLTEQVDETNYSLTTGVGVRDEAVGATEAVEAAEDDVTAAVKRTNSQRQEAIRLTNAIKNSGGSSTIDIKFKTEIGGDISSYIVPHLETHTKLLSSIDKSLKC